MKRKSQSRTSPERHALTASRLRVEFLESRLAPGDYVLSQALGVSMLGAEITGLLGGSETSAPMATAATSDGFALDAGRDLPALVGSVAEAPARPAAELAVATQATPQPLTQTQDVLAGLVSTFPKVTVTVPANRFRADTATTVGGAAVGPAGRDLEQARVLFTSRDGYLPEHGQPSDAELARFAGQIGDADVNAGGELPGGPEADDPGGRGSYSTTQVDYSLGNTTFAGTPGPTEIQARVWYPSGLPDGPYPLVILMHGRHATCHLGASAFLEWPCSAGRSIIPSYQGYDYLADPLASNGYVVVSVGANGVNARDNGVQDLGMQWRALVIQEHLNRWNTWSSTGGGPAGIGNLFIGKVDMQNVGTMGHSRGGEGVAQHWVYNNSLGMPYGIRAVLPLAPVDFNRPRIQDAAQLTILPPCDGDVSDLQGAHFFDDARANNGANDFGYKHLITVAGTNHNHYNTIWTPGLFPAGTFNDSRCTSAPGFLNAAQQRNVGRAYMNAFLRTYLASPFDGKGGSYWGILTNYEPVPASALPAQVLAAYQAPLQTGYRRDINQLLTATNLTTNTVGGSVAQSGLTPYTLCGGNAPQPVRCTDLSPYTEPHTVPSARSTMRGLSQLNLGWSSSTATWTNNIPAASRDVSQFFDVIFRVAINANENAGRNPVNQDQDFSVVLTDGSGNSVSTQVSLWSNSLRYPGSLTSALPLPHLVLNSVSIPLYAFSGVDLTNVASVQFRFDQRNTGDLLVADLGFGI